MAPTRKSRSVNKRYSDYVDVSPGKAGASKSGRQKRKLFNMLGSPWTNEEVERFYIAYRKYGKDWTKVCVSSLWFKDPFQAMCYIAVLLKLQYEMVSAMVRTRNSEMVGALYTMNQAYLSLPEGIASVVGFIAIVSGHYNALEGSDDQEMNDIRKSLHKPKKHNHGLVHQIVVEEDQLQSRVAASIDRRLTQLKRRESDGCTVLKRTPRFPINHSSLKDKSENDVSPQQKNQKGEVDDMAYGAALALTEALQRGGSLQVSQSPYTTKTILLKGRKKIIDAVRTKLHVNLIDEDGFGGSSGSCGVQNIAAEEIYHRGRKFYGQKGENEFVVGREACSGTGGLAVGGVSRKLDIEVAHENSEQSSSLGKKKRNKNLFLRVFVCRFTCIGRGQATNW